MKVIIAIIFVMIYLAAAGILSDDKEIPRTALQRDVNFQVPKKLPFGEILYEPDLIHENSDYFHHHGHYPGRYKYPQWIYYNQDRDHRRKYHHH